jgi:predicted AAA+ superfamily ATPase
MIKRDLEPHLRTVAQYFPVVAILGPRQSGKTTLAQMVFPQHAYVSLEDLDLRSLAIADPRGFLERYKNEHGIILDEFQHVPGILSYIQTWVDREKQQGYFILTGSQNFLVSEAISQTLAGRISLNTLLPLSIQELEANNLLPETLDDFLYTGCYPSLYAKTIPPHLWYPGYIQTYLERDVRQITNVSDLMLFKRFVELCAGRMGQIVNFTSLANDCGISDVTAQRWLNLLEASYIVFLLRPHHENLGKRVVKSAKIYFYDTGLACSLLGIQPEQVATHYLRGGLFEAMVIGDVIKQHYNTGKRPNVYFWRDHTGNEIDLIIERGQELIPVEIKSGQTIGSAYFKGLDFWHALGHKNASSKGYVVYGGKDTQKRTQTTVLGWNIFSSIVD